jgi:hypothetical protein
MPWDASESGLHQLFPGELVLAQSVAPDDAHGGEEDVRSELDARQDEVLHFLDELNDRIEAVMREFAPPPTTLALPASRSAA